MNKGFQLVRIPVLLKVEHRISAHLALRFILGRFLYFDLLCGYLKSSIAIKRKLFRGYTLMGLSLSIANSQRYHC